MTLYTADLETRQMQRNRAEKMIPWILVWEGVIFCKGFLPVEAVQQISLPMHIGYKKYGATPLYRGKSLPHILHPGLFIKAKTRIPGITPRTENRIIPGTRKSLKGEDPRFDRGILSNSPPGEMINNPPPKIAPRDSKPKRTIRTIRDTFVFIGYIFTFDDRGSLRYLNYGLKTLSSVLTR
jgi:hypothetical protein